MEIFYSTFEQTLMIFIFIAAGFFLRKTRLLPEDSHITMAKLETCIFVPALTLYTYMTKCTIKTFTRNSGLILYGFIIIFAALAMSYPLSRLFVRRSSASSELAYQRNIYKYALTFGTYGFFGNFLVLGIWGEDMFYKYSLFTLFAGILCTSWGLYILIPKEHNAGMWVNLKKGLITPPIIALVTGIVLGLLNVAKYVPDFMITAFNNAGKCQGPVAMLLAGFVIGGYDFKSLLTKKKVYIVTALRLIVIPAVILLILIFLDTSKEIMTLALIAFATPLGLNTVVYPAAYGGDTKTGASMAMISHTLSVITIPLMYLVFIVLL